MMTDAEAIKDEIIIKELHEKKKKNKVFFYIHIV